MTRSIHTTTDDRDVTGDAVLEALLAVLKADQGGARTAALRRALDVEDSVDERRTGAAETDVVEVADRVRALEGEIDDLRDGVEDAGSATAGGTDVEILAERIDRLETSLNAVEDRLSSLDARVDRRCGRIESGLETVGKRAARETARVESELETEIHRAETEVSDEIESLRSSTVEAVTTLERDLEDVERFQEFLRQSITERADR
ncbi:hypothetical protein [Halovivax sp.]|uniref:hypothetical protein n=1 Tax=Halovivax sp. TaxID=1935978 RepID=UPI0025BC752C|nr:hypothetical protein [Halovivax sp.]